MSHHRSAANGHADNRRHEQHEHLHHWSSIAAFCLLTALVVFMFLWPDSHVAALLVLATVSSLIASSEMTKVGVPRLWVAATVVLLFGLAAIVFCIVGPVR